jgi:RimJ/RimL family protein N-acetyltransferase
MEDTIETERLRLRPAAAADARAIAKFIGDYEVCKWLSSVPYPYTQDDAKEWLGASRGLAARGEIVNRVIDFGGAAGAIGLSSIKTIEGGRVAEFGYWLARPHWGKGLMSEAARAFLAYAFDGLDFAGLKSGHFKENYRSGRVLTKLGFRYAGEGMKHCLARQADVAHVDVVLTRAQWLEHAAKRAA